MFFKSYLEKKEQERKKIERNNTIFGFLFYVLPSSIAIAFAAFVFPLNNSQYQNEYQDFLENGFSVETACQNTVDGSGSEKWSIEERNTFYGFFLGKRNYFFSLHCYGVKDGELKEFYLYPKIKEMNDAKKKNLEKERVMKNGEWKNVE